MIELILCLVLLTSPIIELPSEVHSDTIIATLTMTFGLQPASEALDAGTEIPGFDMPFYGIAPDMGAIEYRGPVVVTISR